MQPLESHTSHTLHGLPMRAYPLSSRSDAHRNSWFIISWRGMKAGISTLLMSLPTPAWALSTEAAMGVRANRSDFDAPGAPGLPTRCGRGAWRAAGPAWAGALEADLAVAGHPVAMLVMANIILWAHGIILAGWLDVA